MDAKKQNRIIIGTAVILMTMLWISYVVFTVVLDRSYMQATSAYFMASAMIMAMLALTAVKANTPQAVAYTEQIPMVPKKDPSFATNIESAFYGLYQMIHMDKHQDFQDWVKSHMKNRWDEMSQIKPPDDLSDWMFDQDNTYNVAFKGEEELENVYVLEFWARTKTAEKEYLQIIVTNEEDFEIYVRRGSGPATSSSPWSHTSLESLSSDLETEHNQLSPSNTRDRWH